MTLLAITAEKTMLEVGRLAFSDIGRCYDPQGNLRAIHTLPLDVRRCLASSKTIIANAKAGDNQTDEIHEIKLWDKTKNLELLMTHFGLLKVRAELGADDALVKLLQSARARTS